ncbi:uncharacterized protein N7459_007529 [Penicillium hispanicum]|uniref:uncharacterized protein n=1 Tax=Penicillium hispanicum TaxID=1080232 RepID=UPI002540A613|nr:uncharacterized protein N7459_007529 [Penicillium hispanicum]KAJ5578565.1 hypothetical protein N7459_007529 [Penicillium hispanicum]
MAGPGGGPPRKSHTKSRNGCKTCKRRHIRCDETFPQCRNCTKHNCRCDYQDAAPAQGSSPPSRRGPDLLMSPEIEAEIDHWHRTGIPPYPELMQCPRAGWSNLSRAELRLIHHLVGLSIDLHRRGLSSCTVWAQKMPNFLAIALSNEFVMSSILALSAFHLAFLTRDHETKQLAYHHKVTALRGLQTAIGAFSKDNCDAILAASILLSWQATERQGWASLQQGISTVLESMHPFWKQESELAQLVETHRALSASDFPLALDEDLTQLDQTIYTLQVIQKRESHNGEYFQRVGELIEFVQQFRHDYPTQTSDQAFERIQILRRWLFWLPVSMLQGGDTDLNALPVLAQFFAVAVALDRFFPETGGAYLGALSIGPIEEIDRILAAHSAADPFNAELRLAMTLMNLPRHIAARYRSRLAWSPRPSVEHYSPDSSSPYHGLHEYPLASSSSPASASPSYAAYTPPLQSPPAVNVAGSPFHPADGYVTAAPSHALYPPSPHLLDTHDARLGLSELAHTASVPQSSFTPPHSSGVLCADMHGDGQLGLNMEVYPQTQSFEMPGLLAPEPCWT